MIRFLSAGESHGKGLTVMLDGVPAGLIVDETFINHQLTRRQLGYGRGGRMSIEKDAIELMAGVRRGITTGAPVVFWIVNRDYKNWETVMEPSAKAIEAWTDRQYDEEEKAFYRPRPGHADLAGFYKFGMINLRDILERSSARETASRVAAGALAQLFLKALGIQIYSHVLCIGQVEAPVETLPTTHQAIIDRAESNDLRTAGSENIQQQMRHRIDQALKEGVTLGGRIEVVAIGVPAGFGSYTQWDKRLDGQLAQALMSIQAVKSVSIGAGSIADQVDGSAFHDSILLDSEDVLTRPTNRAGGLEGGVTNGMPVVAHVVMKPISTMRKALPSVNLKTRVAEEAHFERSDVTAVPACGVIAEAMMALTLANAILDKLGGDSMSEIMSHFESSLQVQQALWEGSPTA